MRVLIERADDLALKKIRLPRKLGHEKKTGIPEKFLRLSGYIPGALLGIPGKSCDRPGRLRMYAI